MPTDRFLTAAERVWLTQVLPDGKPEMTASLWISEADCERPYIDMAYGDPTAKEVILDGVFTYEQLVALVGIMKLRQVSSTDPACLDAALGS